MFFGKLVDALNHRDGEGAASGGDGPIVAVLGWGNPRVSGAWREDLPGDAQADVRSVRMLLSALLSCQGLEPRTRC
jgi:hypothetical protein